ncbi:hypothetical protein LR48_Vigan03g221200 [Vigna angularis]|uniref:Uncharacterized protein n=1 Tax=Phaseolus angularis TaxID=3914 RepID=A0A0L9U7M7_PHAAN|nr:hypothetical protein LR48_Vigan03g221200 [Vigna angularis]
MLVIPLVPDDPRTAPDKTHRTDGRSRTPRPDGRDRYPPRRTERTDFGQRRKESHEDRAETTRDVQT